LLLFSVTSCRHLPRRFLHQEEVSQLITTMTRLWKMAHHTSTSQAAYTTVGCRITTGRIVYWRCLLPASMQRRRTRHKTLFLAL